MESGQQALLSSCQAWLFSGCVFGGSETGRVSSRREHFNLSKGGAVPVWRGEPIVEKETYFRSNVSAGLKERLSRTLDYANIKLI